MIGEFRYNYLGNYTILLANFRDNTFPISTSMKCTYFNIATHIFPLMRQKSYESYLIKGIIEIDFYMHSKVYPSNLTCI